MPFTLTCPHCDAELTIPDEVAGKKIRCKSCSEVLRADPPVKKKVAKPAPVEDDEDEEDEPTPPPRKGSGKRSGKPKTIPVSAGAKGLAFGSGLALFLGGLLAAGYAGGFLGGKKSNTDPKGTTKANNNDDKSGSTGAAIDVAITDLKLDRLPPAFVGEHFRFGAPEYNDGAGEVVLKYSYLKGDFIPHNYQVVIIFANGSQVTDFPQRDSSGKLQIPYQDGRRPRLQVWIGRYPDNRTDIRMAPRRVSDVVDIR